MKNYLIENQSKLLKHLEQRIGQLFSNDSDLNKSKFYGEGENYQEKKLIFFVLLCLSLQIKNRKQDTIMAISNTLDGY